MKVSLRHIAGVALTLALIAGAVWVWNQYPIWLREPFLRPYRADLLTWRIPILAILGFAVLSGLHWVGAQLTKTESGN